MLVVYLNSLLKVIALHALVDNKTTIELRRLGARRIILIVLKKDCFLKILSKIITYFAYLFKIKAIMLNIFGFSG